MIRFNELAISNNGRNLIIDAEVRDMPYYKNGDDFTVFIDKIYVVVAGQYTDMSDAEKPDNHVYEISMGDDEELHKYRTVLTDREVCGLHDELLYVIVKTKGTFADGTPCGMDDEYTLGAVYWEGPIYHKFMDDICELGKRCVIPRDFIDTHLRLVALKAAIEAGQYVAAARIWDEFFKHGRHDVNHIRPSKGCGCHG